ncbi:glycosyltransferase family 1 protein [Telmatospirillum sp.]|uniref:glycosyltransferase family 4 protein n=1 Tax=Telmatospirillum sp. TaxID=2079197 RepID=UPI002847432B|nr:glycosyltransferase family 1 protein [Telmatospirillum sp.]MDR3435907.1 glycosyltransferase family 1 protein [Telmatospirillum sp.]
MRIAIVTDAWHPQPNGVVRVLSSLCERLEAAGHTLFVVAPDSFRTIPCPTYSEIPLAIGAGPGVARQLDAFRPEAVHIATEGPLGWAARRHCLRRGWPFTTAYHTKFPQYLHARTRLPLAWLYGVVRRFHAPSSAVMVPSHSVFEELTHWGFSNLRQWSHGVDTQIFRPQGKTAFDFPRPIYLFVGRVTIDKNIPAFLDLPLDGTKVVVGSGPQRDALMRHYPAAKFVIAYGDAQLSSYFSAADVLVFPSLTDTFGLVMLEALASGVPVAAFPVAGPRDVLSRVSPGCPVGVLDEDLASAAIRARPLSPADCRAYAERFSWDHVVTQFLDYLAPVPL